jgi:hypothetical protein
VARFPLTLKDRIPNFEGSDQAAKLVSTLAEWEKVKVRIHLTEFFPIRDTKSCNRLVQRSLIHDGLDPLLTNNKVFSYLYSGYDNYEIKEIKLEVKVFNAD